MIMIGNRGMPLWLCIILVAATAVIEPARAGPIENLALIAAALRLDIEAVESALANGANPNAQTRDQSPVTPIQAVTIAFSNLGPRQAQQRAISVAKLLFEHGARLSSHDRDILFHPIANGYSDLVAFLLEKGASPVHRTYGYTPTELAVKHNEQAIYDLLIANGGRKVNERDALQIALVHAVWEDDHTRMWKAVEDGARINTPDVSGTAPLMSALDRPVFDFSRGITVGWLIKNSADVNQMSKVSGFDEKTELPLHVFISRNALSMNGNDESARYHAERMMRLILKAGAKVSGLDSDDRTPLHVASKSDNLRAAEIILEAGARISPRDALGKQPLDYAESATMIKLLKHYGAKE